MVHLDPSIILWLLYVIIVPIISLGTFIYLVHAMQKAESKVEKACIIASFIILIAPLAALYSHMIIK